MSNTDESKTKAKNEEKSDDPLTTAEHMIGVFTKQLETLLYEIIVCSVSFLERMLKVSLILMLLFMIAVAFLLIFLRAGFFDVLKYADIVFAGLATVINGMAVAINAMANVGGSALHAVSFGHVHKPHLNLHVTARTILGSKFYKLMGLSTVCSKYKGGFGYLSLAITNSASPHVCPLTRYLYYSPTMYSASNALLGWMHWGANPNGNNCRKPDMVDMCVYLNMGYFLEWLVVAVVVVIAIVSYWPCIKIVLGWITTVVEFVVHSLVHALEKLADYLHGRINGDNMSFSEGVLYRYMVLASKEA